MAWTGGARPRVCSVRTTISHAAFDDRLVESKSRRDVRQHGLERWLPSSKCSFIREGESRLDYPTIIWVWELMTFQWDDADWSSVRAWILIRYSFINLSDLNSKFRSSKLHASFNFHGIHIISRSCVCAAIIHTFSHAPSSQPRPY